MRTTRCCFLIFTLLLSQGAMVCAGELRFHRHYDDNMVLQRAKPVLIREFADKGAEVTVNFANQTRKPKADGNGLPAIEFNTDGHDYPKNIRTLGQEILPEEFSKPISEWKNEGAVIVNGRMDKKPEAGKALGPRRKRAKRPTATTAFTTAACI